uniref:Uncharacterized protein n=1 Tax=Globodera rostochiensis TaxID=31243 RepID=A0A914IDQ4_GLORO
MGVLWRPNRALIRSGLHIDQQIGGLSRQRKPMRVEENRCERKRGKCSKGGQGRKIGAMNINECGDDWKLGIVKIDDKRTTTESQFPA